VLGIQTSGRTVGYLGGLEYDEVVAAGWVWFGATWPCLTLVLAIWFMVMPTSSLSICSIFIYIYSHARNVMM
jgi:hypothetical protein